jgi:hypothetical protein
MCLIFHLYPVFHKCKFGFVPTVCAPKRGGGGFFTDKPAFAGATEFDPKLLV